MEDTFYNALNSSPDELLCLAVKNNSRPNKASLKVAIHRSSKEQAIRLCGSLSTFSDLQVQAFQNLDSAQNENVVDEFKTPSPKRKRRKRACNVSSSSSACSPEKGRGKISRKDFILSNLKACAIVTHLALSHPKKVFQPCDLFPTVQTLHDQLVYFEDDIELQEIIATLCEIWWKDHHPGRESLIAQSLPFLLSKSLEFGKKTHVHRVYNMREAFTLFDFVDESIEDLKHLLMRCVLTPAYLRSIDGCRFITFLFNINGQLAKELIVMVKSQIPFGRKSILESYGDILFRAWKVSSDDGNRGIIEEFCVQSLIEGAVYASSKTLASSIRKVLASFTAQRTQADVEALLFRLQEPILFRSLQVANSNVRRNALLLLIDMFPLVDPDASKEENDTLLDKQFVFFEKLLIDPCPDVRVTAVEGVCRILRLFWEVVSASTTVKLISKLIDETSQDKSSTAVRCAVIQGITYLLDNPASHDLAKALLPRLGSLFSDSNLAVRIAVVEMLIALKGIRSISFLKVVGLKTLLSALESDKPPLARRITRLLIPSYFPAKVPAAQACNRVLALIKRSHHAGARFCEWAMMEGVPLNSLLELVKFFVSHLASPNRLDAEGREGIFLALNKLCHSLGKVKEKELKALLGTILTRETLKSLLVNSTTTPSRTSVVLLVSLIAPTDVPELFEYCSSLVINSVNDALSPLDCYEARAVHSLMLAWGGFDDLISALIHILTQVASNTSDSVIPFSSSSEKSLKRTRSQIKGNKSPWTDSMSKRFNSAKGKKAATGSEGGQSTKSLTCAIRAAWHVDNLLEMDETRSALLAHERLPVLVSMLRKTVHSVLHNSLDLQVSDFLKASSIRAYTALTIHTSLRKRSGQRVASTSSSEEQQDPITAVCREVMQWSMGLQNFSVPRSPLPNVRKKTKYTRTLRSRQREPLTDISNNTTHDDSSCSSSSEVRMFLNRINLSNISLDSLSHFFSLNLVKDNAVWEAWLELIIKLLNWTRSWLKTWEGEDFKNWKKECNSQCKDLLSSVRETATQGAKMLYVSLRNDAGRATQYAGIANDLLDLIIYSDNFFGSKAAASLLVSIKPWVPDIFICISSSIKAVGVTQELSLHGCDALSGNEVGKIVSRLWVASLSKTAFESMKRCKPEARENAPEIPQDKENKIHERSCFPIQFLDEMSNLLRRGDSMVLEGISSLYLLQALVSSQVEDYCTALGALDIVYTKLLLPSKSLKPTLSETDQEVCEELKKHIDRRMEEVEISSSEDEQRRTIMLNIKTIVENLPGMANIR